MHIKPVQNCDPIGPSKSKLEQQVFPQDFKYKLINLLWSSPPRAYCSQTDLDDAYSAVI